MKPLDLHLNGTGVAAERSLGELVISFKAQAIREERDAAHARLAILCNQVELAWTNCNVEKDEERVRLINRAWPVLSPGLTTEQRTEYHKELFKHDLDHFCHHLWAIYLNQFSPQEAEGLEHWQPTFLLNPYIILGGGTIMFAPPKTAKSYMAMLMAQSVHSNSSALWPVQKENTLFVNLERSHISVRGRLARVNQVLGLDPNASLPMLPGRGRSLKALAPVLERYVAEHYIGFGVLDSISRTGMGGLIAPEEVNPVIDLLSRLFPSWLAIAHTPRASGEHVYGGQMWDAGADILLMLKSQLNETNISRLGVSLTVTMANDIPIPPPQFWELDFAEGFSIQEVKAKDYPELAGSNKQSLTQEVLDYLLEAQKATATQIATQLDKARPNVVALLKHDTRFIRVGPVGPKGQVYYGVKQPPGSTPEEFR